MNHVPARTVKRQNLNRPTYIKFLENKCIGFEICSNTELQKIGETKKRFRTGKVQNPIKLHKRIDKNYILMLEYVVQYLLYYMIKHKFNIAVTEATW